jgi:hypothetical protein
LLVAAQLTTEKLFEKGIVSPMIQGGKRILEGRPPQTPLSQRVERGFLRGDPSNSPFSKPNLYYRAVE